MIKSTDMIDCRGCGGRVGGQGREAVCADLYGHGLVLMQRRPG